MRVLPALLDVGRFAAGYVRRYAEGLLPSDGQIGQHRYRREHGGGFDERARARVRSSAERSQ